MTVGPTGLGNNGGFHHHPKTQSVHGGLSCQAQAPQRDGGSGGNVTAHNKLLSGLGCTDTSRAASAWSWTSDADVGHVGWCPSSRSTALPHHASVGMSFASMPCVDVLRRWVLWVWQVDVGAFVGHVARTVCCPGGGLEDTTWDVEWGSAGPEVVDGTLRLLRLLDWQGRCA